MPEDGAGLGESGQPSFDVGQVRVDQLGEVSARGGAGIPDGQDPADVGQGETGGLGVTDELQAGDRLGLLVHCQI